MQTWVATVRETAFRLEAADFQVMDIILILALTRGLPESYSSFIVSLDSTPLHELSVDTVITRLLNEEARQQGVAPAKPPKLEVDFPHAMFARDSSSTRSRAPTSPIRCYNCGGKGHVARDCPSPRQKVQEQKDREIAGMATEVHYDGDLSC